LNYADEARRAEPLPWLSTNEKVDMDLEAIALLAGAAGQALVQAMASEGWVQIRDRVASLISRGNRQRQQQAADRLESTRAALQSGQSERTAEIAHWKGLLEEVISQYPEVADELRELVAEVRAQCTDLDVTVTVHAGRDSYVARDHQTVIHHHHAPRPSIDERPASTS
jgi:hypothetical protein